MASTLKSILSQHSPAEAPARRPPFKPEPSSLPAPAVAAASSPAEDTSAIRTGLPVPSLQAGLRVQESLLQDLDAVTRLLEKRLFGNTEFPEAPVETEDEPSLGEQIAQHNRSAQAVLARLQAIHGAV